MHESTHYRTTTYSLNTLIGWCQPHQREASQATDRATGTDSPASAANHAQYLTGDEEGCLLLPCFQRESVWEESEQLDFVASILAGLPLGAMTLAEVDASNASRLLRADGLPYRTSKRRHRPLLVLDGRQRLHAALRAFKFRFRSVKSHQPTAPNMRLFGIDLARLAEVTTDTPSYSQLRASISVSRNRPSKADFKPGKDPTPLDLAARDTKTCIREVENWLSAPSGKMPRLWVPLAILPGRCSGGESLLGDIKKLLSSQELRQLDHLEQLLKRLQVRYSNAQFGCTLLSDTSCTDGLGGDGSRKYEDYEELQRLVFLQLNTNGQRLTAAHIVAAHLDLRPVVDEIMARQKAMSSLSYAHCVELTVRLQGGNAALARSIADMRERIDSSGLDDHLKNDVKSRAEVLCRAASAVDQFLETECGVRSGDDVPSTAVLRALCFVTADILLRAHHGGRPIEDSSMERIWEISDGFFGQGLRAWWFRQCASQLLENADSSGLVESLTHDLNDHRRTRFERFAHQPAASVAELPTYPMNTKAAKLFGTLLRSVVKRDYRSGADLAQSSSTPQLHHIFPKAWCIRRGIPADQYDSFANLTWIGGYTNVKMRDRSPGEILETCTEFERRCITDNLAQQGLTTEVLRADHFAEAMRLRGEWLHGLLASAQGGPSAPK